MANQLNPLDDEENKQVTTAQSGVVGGGTSDAGGAAAGSGWTNLNQYLDANKGAGEQIANAAVQDTGNQFASDKSSINDWSKGLQDNIAGQKQADTAQAQQYSGQAANAGSNFGQAAQQQSFDAWKKASENKPGQFEDQGGYQGAYGAQSRIKDNMNLIKDPNNQSKIIADAFRKNNPTYSSGMGKLDTFLATADGGNSLNQKLSGLAGQYSGDYLGDSKNAYGAGVTDLTNTMGKNREDVMGAISNQYKTLKGQADTGVAQMNRGQNTNWAGKTIASANDASYADVLDPNKLADLEALSALSGQSFDANQKNKTFNAGQYAAPGAAVVAPVVAKEDRPARRDDLPSNPPMRTSSPSENYIDSRVTATGKKIDKWIKPRIR
jgi:hypothetical protein